MLICLACFQCSDDSRDTALNVQPSFELLKGEQTGLTSVNVLTMTEEFNVFQYMNFFNGGGVAVGDFNKDGLEDLFFTRNQLSNKLYLNRGDLKFEDVTEQARLIGQTGFTTGASVVDINNDGMLDIYVGQLGDFSPIEGKTQLYVCEKIEDGIPVFKDRAEDYGIAYSGLAQQAAFFDYDRDGDLDMFQLNQSVHQSGISRGRKAVPKKDKRSGDRLLRNESHGDEIHFVDVTLESGIESTVLGFGLGVVVGDINLDGWPDFYVCNDFHENDYLYINQRDGTFRESISESLMHSSRFSMGVDMADINNDGWPEIYTLDMLPSDPYILKTSLGEDGYNVYQLKLSHGYHHQYARNNLQLNNTNGTFSDVGIFANAHASDWSWASLFLDFDHDGYRDLFISNGIPRRMNNIDYVNFKLYGRPTENSINEPMITDSSNLLNIVKEIPQIKIKNRFLRNNQQLEFDDIDAQILGSVESYSNGAAYVDLDNDGDLDIVTNNIEDEPFIYKNLLIESGANHRNYLKFKLKGSPANRNAIGAKILLRLGEQTIIEEYFPVRGYMSSMALGIHIGIGDSSFLTEAIVIWPDGTFEKIEDFTINAQTTLEWKANLPPFDYSSLKNSSRGRFQFEDISSDVGIEFRHRENQFVEFDRESLMPHMISTEGPALAIGDVNGDDLQDFFIGGAHGDTSGLFVQTVDGFFQNITPKALISDDVYEDTDANFADIDNDGDQDLLVASGGNQFENYKEGLQQRAYINDGTGQFEMKDLFPEAMLTASCITPGDFDGDGYFDVFIGGRAVAGFYGRTPHSYLYQNNGDGTFRLVTDRVSPNLENVGMVKHAEWSDVDGDNDLDLILALEWDVIHVFENENGKLIKRPINDLKGWWNFTISHDFDGDGDIDILAGNLGKNTRLKASKEEPITCYIDDFDNNNKLDQVLTYYLEGREYVWHTHDELVKQLPDLKKKYLYATDFAKATVAEMFGKKALENSQQLSANFMESAWFENKGDLKFEVHILPDRLQFSTLQSAALADLNEDGKMEVLLGGNFYANNIEMGRYDADFGNVLIINADKSMEVHPFDETPIKGQIRKIETITTSKGTYYIFARNDNSAVVLRKK